MIIGAMTASDSSNGASALLASVPGGGRVPMPHWGLIEALGPDAATFLQGQLTNDVAALDGRRWCLAGYCSAKGRLLASFIVWRPEPERFLLACSADLLEPTLKRLRMFVLRAKCTLTEATPRHRLWGVWGHAVHAEVAAAPAGCAWLGAANGLEHPSSLTLRMHGLATVPMAWVVESAADSTLVASDDRANSDAVVADDLAAWRWLEVASGVPRIAAASVDALVPQMVNLELLDGVNFRKGCYPGQEVVARSQYRGTLKRRMHAFAGEAKPVPGDEMFHASDPAQPAGVVVDAAELHGRSLALVSVKSSVLDPSGTTDLHLRAPNGAPLREVGMPYVVPAEATDPA